LAGARTEALLERKGKSAPYLALAIARELPTRKPATALAGECGTDPLAENQRRIEALAWVMEFIDALG
jgi:hypothetical protein